MANVATVAETSAARAFLTYLSADPNNRGMVQAVVAWFRQESGSLSRVIGNNPFNIRSSPLASSYRQTRSNGRFAIFPSLDVGFRAAARLLLSMGERYGYGAVVRAARAGNPRDFLMALALSSWDAGHYGMPKVNHLIDVYNGITGLQIAGPPKVPPKPKPTVPPIVTPKPTPLPVMPTALKPPTFATEFIDGFAVHRFYAARHRQVDGLPVAGDKMRRRHP